MERRKNLRGKKITNHKILNISDEHFDKFVFYACMIDIFFMPYVWFFSTNYSILLAVYWFYINNHKIRDNKEYKIFLHLAFLMMLSTLFSFILFPPVLGYTSIWVENTKRLFQFISYFFYYFLFYYYFKTYKVSIKPYLFIFVIFVFSLAVMYNIDKIAFSYIKIYWNNKDPFTIMLHTGKWAEYRYNFIWTDPNNVAYALVAIVTFLYCNERTNYITKVIIFFSLLLILISCMSNGGFISFITVCFLMILIILPKKIVGLLKFNKIKIRISSIFTTILALFLVYLIIMNIDNYLQSDVAKESVYRMDSNSGESRVNIWKNTLNSDSIFKYFFLGTGANTVIDGEVKAVHNGHLYWKNAYGMIAYIFFMYIFFRKRKDQSWQSYIFVIPILIGFTINVIIGEQKMIILYLLLITAASSKLYQKNAIGEKDE